MVSLRSLVFVTADREFLGRGYENGVRKVAARGVGSSVYWVT